MREILVRPRLYVRNWVERRGLVCNKVGNFLTTEGRDVDYNLEGSLYLDYLDDLHTHNEGLPYQDRSYIKREQRQVHLTRLKEVLNAGEFSAVEDLTELRRWCHAVRGFDDPKIVAIMAHWCQMVKKKADDRHVDNEIMPVLYNPTQGGGKSTAIRSLL